MKILIVDDDSAIGYGTKQMLGEKNHINGEAISVIRVNSNNKTQYKEAQESVIKAYKLDPHCIVLMDFNLGSEERTGGTFIRALVAQGMPLENFIGVSTSFEDDNGCKIVPGLHCDFGLRHGDMSEETKKRLGLAVETKPLRFSTEPPDMMV